MTHRYHPDEDRGDPPDALLYDDCEDCDLYLRDPVARLDDQRLRLAIQRVQGRDAGRYRPKTRAEVRLLDALGSDLWTARRIVRLGLLGQEVNPCRTTSED